MMTNKTTTGLQARLQIEADAAFYGIIPTTDTQGKIRWVVTCTFCGKKNDFFRSDINDAEQIINHFRKQGWVFNRKEFQYCSTIHAREAKETKRVERETERIEEMKHPVQPAPPVAPVTAIGPDPKIVRRVITLLNDHFDTERRLYEDNWSDDRVAKEAGTSLEFVTKYRKDAYGELAGDPVLLRLEADIKALDELFLGQLKSLESSFSQQINELRTRLQMITKSHKAGG